MSINKDMASAGHHSDSSMDSNFLRVSREGIPIQKIYICVCIYIKESVNVLLRSFFECISMQGYKPGMS